MVDLKAGECSKQSYFVSIDKLEWLASQVQLATVLREVVARLSLILYRRVFCIDRLAIKESPLCVILFN